jgi:single-strand DNA-binding protein
VTFKIEARRVGILPYRIETITLIQKPREEAEAPTPAMPTTTKEDASSSGKKPRKS